MKITKRTVGLIFLGALSAALLTAQAAKPATGATVTPLDAFTRMKTLVGQWQGTGADKGQSMPIQVSYKLTGAGTTLVETLFVGTPHEMMTMYHLNGPKELRLTHYCSAGNQPSMVLDPVSTKDHLVFVFSSGTNMDPARDMHMHKARIRFVDADHVESEWDMFQGGKLADTKKFSLTRQK